MLYGNNRDVCVTLMTARDSRKQHLRPFACSRTAPSRCTTWRAITSRNCVGTMQPCLRKPE